MLCLPASLRPLHTTTLICRLLLIKIYRHAMGESSSDSASYIRMVQHLIEKCLIFSMNKDECIEALSKHANIKPVITSTVWQELEKENKEFFRSYSRKDKEERTLDMEAMQRIQKMLAESASRDPDED